MGNNSNSSQLSNETSVMLVCLLCLCVFAVQVQKDKTQRWKVDELHHRGQEFWVMGLNFCLIVNRG